ncbi:MAG: leucine-rich repeat domain-containing protein [Muribaculaceae bacterium]|nr:leucine-rich repeat domain-containing protein [Muribaculaceae bacterium]
MCSGLTSVTIPEGVTSIGEGAFSWCSDLEKAEFASVEALCKISFKSCDANPLCYAHNLYINGEKITDLIIPAGVTSICNYAFYYCSGLTSVTIPEGVTSIGEGAFSSCRSLTSVTIPEGVTSIAEWAFGFCFSLTSVTIPEGVTSIGENAFSSCSSLISVYYGADQLIAGNANIFSQETYDKATLYLTEDGIILSSFKDPWKNFKNIEEYDFTNAIDNVTADFKESAPYEIYDINGVKAGDNINALSPGLYIIRQGKTVKKIMVK